MNILFLEASKVQANVGLVLDKSYLLLMHSLS